jgi:hypothetical protein
MLTPSLKVGVNTLGLNPQTVLNYFAMHASSPKISSPKEDIQSSKRANKKLPYIADFGRKFSHSARVTKMTNLICYPEFLIEDSSVCQGQPGGLMATNIHMSCKIRKSLPVLGQPA